MNEDKTESLKHDSRVNADAKIGVY